MNGSQMTFQVSVYTQAGRIDGLPIRERPASRIENFGPGAVSLIELLAAIIGGAKQIEIAESLIRQYKTLARIFNTSARELEKIAGLGHATAVKIKAALELGMRLTQEAAKEKYDRIRSPAVAANLIMDKMSLLEREELWILILDVKNNVTSITHLYKGSLNTTTIRVSEIFHDAVRHTAAGIIIAHNHPSGDPMPSPEDVRVTERIVAAGKMLDIDVLDHLIIGHQRFVSMKERRLGFS